MLPLEETNFASVVSPRSLYCLLDKMSDSVNFLLILQITKPFIYGVLRMKLVNFW